MKPIALLTYLCLLLLIFLLSHPTFSHPAATATAITSPQDIHIRGRFTCKRASVKGPLSTSARALVRQIERWHNTQCTQDRRFEPKCTELAKDGDEARVAICGYPRGWIFCSLVAFAVLEIVAGCTVPSTGRAAGEYVYDGKPGMRVVVYKAGNGP